MHVAQSRFSSSFAQSYAGEPQRQPRLGLTARALLLEAKSAEVQETCKPGFPDKQPNGPPQRQVRSRRARSAIAESPGSPSEPRRPVNDGRSVQMMAVCTKDRSATVSEGAVHGAGDNPTTSRLLRRARLSRRPCACLRSWSLLRTTSTLARSSPWEVPFAFLAHAKGVAAAGRRASRQTRYFFSKHPLFLSVAPKQPVRFRPIAPTVVCNTCMRRPRRSG